MEDFRGSAFGLRPLAMTENFTNKYRDYKSNTNTITKPGPQIFPNKWFDVCQFTQTIIISYIILVTCHNDYCLVELTNYLFKLM